MKYLLDTHAALWVFNGSAKMPAHWKETLRQPDAEVYFHQTSTWEITIKYGLGKLSLPDHPETFLPEAIRKTGLIYESIRDQAIYLLRKLPEIHRDPFDRLLIASALASGMTLVTADPQIKEYPVVTL